MVSLWLYLVGIFTFAVFMEDAKMEDTPKLAVYIMSATWPVTMTMIAILSIVSEITDAYNSRRSKN